MGPRRDYHTLSNGRQVHYLRAGEGDPALLLHPSPLSASFLRPLIDFLSGSFDVIAMDTPGYGSSDPLEEPGDDLVPYVDAITHFARAVGGKHHQIEPVRDLVNAIFNRHAGHEGLHSRISGFERPT